MTRPTSPYRLEDATDKPIHQFATAEEAWFWFVRTEKARVDRARQPRWNWDGERPCEPDDIFRCVAALYDRDVLYPLHLDVLGEYGYLDRQPYIDYDEEVVDYVIWVDALDALEPYLREKGIVE